MDVEQKTFVADAVSLAWPLHRIVLQEARREEDAKDLVQETLLRAWRSFSPTQEHSYRRSWLSTILRNVALEWRRKAQERLRWQPAADSELDALPLVGDPVAPMYREFLAIDLPAVAQLATAHSLDIQERANASQSAAPGVERPRRIPGARARALLRARR